MKLHRRSSLSVYKMQMRLLPNTCQHLDIYEGPFGFRDRKSATQYMFRYNVQAWKFQTSTRRRNGRRDPRFAISLWNVQDRIENGLPRTNNTVEGWHRSFQSGVGAHHPNIWRFLDVLKREQSLNELNISQMFFFQMCKQF